MYRIGYTTWEHPSEAWTAQLAQRLDREEVERERPLGRALDLGCGRGQYAPSWSGGAGRSSVSTTPRGPSTPARSRGIGGATFLVGDVTDLPVDQLGTFDFFVDVGCFQHLDALQRQRAGRGIKALANPAATLLMMAFSRPTPIGSFVKGVSRTDVQAAFPDWEVLDVEAADTGGMGLADEPHAAALDAAATALMKRLHAMLECRWASPFGSLADRLRPRSWSPRRRPQLARDCSTVRCRPALRCRRGHRIGSPGVVLVHVQLRPQLGDQRRPASPRSAPCTQQRHGDTADRGPLESGAMVAGRLARRPVRLRW